MKPGIYWCDACKTTLRLENSAVCSECKQPMHYLTTDARPVFSRERRILQFYGYGPLTTDVVWKSSKSRFYYINGQSVALPFSKQLKNDLPAIAAYIRDSVVDLLHHVLGEKEGEEL